METWWRSDVNRSLFLCFAACRMRSTACDTLARSCARSVLCWPAFPSAPALRSTGSAAGDPALFVGFVAVGSEVARSIALTRATVRRSNWTCSFPASSFHEWAFRGRNEGISETKLTSLNSPRIRLVGYSLQAAFRHRLVRCDQSLRMIHPSS